MAREMLQPSLMSASPTLSHDIPVFSRPTIFSGRNNRVPVFIRSGALSRKTADDSSTFLTDFWSRCSDGALYFLAGTVVTLNGGEEFAQAPAGVAELADALDSKAAATRPDERVGMLSQELRTPLFQYFPGGGELAEQWFKNDEAAAALEIIRRNDSGRGTADRRVAGRDAEAKTRKDGHTVNIKSTGESRSEWAERRSECFWISRQAIVSS